jgi:hypothetical protein
LPGTLRGVAKSTQTPWGAAEIVDELVLPQRAGDRRFAAMIQLLAGAKGEPLVRFAFATDGVARRGPVTLRARDVARLRDALGAHPALAAALRLDGGGA